MLEGVVSRNKTSEKERERERESGSGVTGKYTENSEIMRKL